MADLKIVVGDITKQEVDAVVNAANKSLTDGSGVNGAIHKAAGPEINAACKKLGSIETGEAKMTPGYELSAKYVIHTAGPIYQDGEHGEPELLAKSYRSALQLVKDYGLSSVAFPAISTGAYGYPKDEAARIAVKAVRESIEEKGLEDIEVFFVLWSGEDAEYYRSLLEKN